MSQDNFEWQSGLSSKFGIQYVNQSSPNLERTYKLSAHVLVSLSLSPISSTTLPSTTCVSSNTAYRTLTASFRPSAQRDFGKQHLQAN